ncbi:MAG: hypothetical protein K6G26_08345 [Lachnospiraceae bacterium]|nr:hypothetical protein [Lachnospiraceae bacterium]
MEEKKNVTVSMGTAICMVVIVILLLALGITYYFGFVKKEGNKSKGSNVENTESVENGKEEKIEVTAEPEKESNNDKPYLGIFKFKEIIQNGEEEKTVMEVFGSGARTFGIGNFYLEENNRFRDEIAPIYDDEDGRKGNYNVNGNEIMLTYDNGRKGCVVYNPEDDTLVIEYAEDTCLLYTRESQ